MALRTGNRNQLSLLPSAIELYVSADDPVRAYDVMIDAMDLSELGLEIDPQKVGNPKYDPLTMLKLLIYGCSYGINSSRKLERAVYHNLSFIWLMGGLKPDHKTIANFKRNNVIVLEKVLKQSVRICLELDLIKGNQLFVDGTKIRGNCSRDTMKSKSSLEKRLFQIDKHIEEMLLNFDELEQDADGSYVKLEQDISKSQQLRDKINGILHKMDEAKLERVNTTDTDARMFKSRQGSHAGYNGQVVTDGANGLIVSADVVVNNNDLGQFSGQIENANDNIGVKCETAVGDAGYFKVDDLEKISSQEIDVIVPTQKQALKNPINEAFAKYNFTYDESKNEYICPLGNRLVYGGYDKSRNRYRYRMKHKEDCLRCPNFGKCTSSNRGRTIFRLFNEKIKERIESRYASDEGQEIYSIRKQVAELPFGHFKSNLNGSHFLLRGLKLVKGEFALFASCFNISRMITLFGGVGSMLAKLDGMRLRQAI